jgi:hypothetical protein
MHHPRSFIQQPLEKTAILEGRFRSQQPAASSAPGRPGARTWRPGPNSSVANIDPPGFVRFPVIGDISHAAHFVKANWPRESTHPVFDSQAKPMTLTFALTTATVRDLQDTLTRATNIDGPLAKSARAFRMLLATKLAGKLIPDTESPSSGNRAS